MALDTLPSLSPDYGSSAQKKPRVLTSNFGDGYSQRAAAGINPLSQVWQLSWSALSTTDANTLDAFFVAKGGHTAFLWTPPRESTALKWICQEWSRSISHPNNDSITATFIQVFDLDE